jgi:hypothetical protein
MKTGKWIAIAAVTFIALVASSYFPFYQSLTDAVEIAGANGLALIAAAIFGYIMIYIVEKNDRYGFVIIILMPWLPVGLLTLLALIVFPQVVYVIESLFIFLLIASSLGGYIAHKKRGNMLPQNEK